MFNKKDFDKMFELALSARENAYCPYSKFPVGAAILTASGKIYVGCNVENVAFGTTQCAEANAVGNMCSDIGASDIKAVIVVTDTPDGVFPCGNCTQTLGEFIKDDALLMACNLSGLQREISFRTANPTLFATKFSWEK